VARSSDSVRTNKPLVVAAVVTVGAAAAQVDRGSGLTWSPVGVTLSLGTLGGIVGISMPAVPLLSRLGASSTTITHAGWPVSCSCLRQQ
jgi:hypothetical protein